MKALIALALAANLALSAFTLTREPIAYPQVSITYARSEPVSPPSAEPAKAQPVPPPGLMGDSPVLLSIAVNSPLAMLEAVRFWPEEERLNALRVAWCESNWRDDVIGLLGEEGEWQLHPIHGDVPDLLDDRALQASQLWREAGENGEIGSWAPWSCKP